MKTIRFYRSQIYFKQIIGFGFFMSLMIIHPGYIFASLFIKLSLRENSLMGNDYIKSTPISNRKRSKQLIMINLVIYCCMYAIVLLSIYIRSILGPPYLIPDIYRKITIILTSIVFLYSFIMTVINVYESVYKVLGDNYRWFENGSYILVGFPATIYGAYLYDFTYSFNNLPSSSINYVPIIGILLAILACTLVYVYFAKQKIDRNGEISNLNMCGGKHNG